MIQTASKLLQENPQEDVSNDRLKVESEQQVFLRETEASPEWCEASAPVRNSPVCYCKNKGELRISDGQDFGFEERLKMFSMVAAAGKIPGSDRRLLLSEAPSSSITVKQP
ncbi:hypothetical protein FQA47_019138 [Oryzias melastigma]|uniref:Uncharacterized protein n=1 Tax=Oryzias melastigma TaxID=30732 RepID=A0A834FAD2_ORYME|nr:hypothetical protein FQA47_019138 [Oryzias melastigma]